MAKGTPVPGRVRYTQSKLEFLRKLRGLLKSKVCECTSHGALHKWGEKNNISLYPKLTSALEKSGLINVSSRGTIWASTVDPNMKTVSALDALLTTLDVAGHVDGHRKNKSKKNGSVKVEPVVAPSPSAKELQDLLRPDNAPTPSEGDGSVQMSYPKGSSVEYHVGADRTVALEFNGTTIILKGCHLKISF